MLSFARRSFAHIGDVTSICVSIEYFLDFFLQISHEEIARCFDIYSLLDWYMLHSLYFHLFSIHAKILFLPFVGTKLGNKRYDSSSRNYNSEIADSSRKFSMSVLCHAKRYSLICNGN